MTLQHWIAFAYDCDGDDRACLHWSPTAEEAAMALAQAEHAGWYIGTDGRAWCPQHRAAALAREERP